MRRASAPLLISAALGFVLALPGDAAAFCGHGLLHCWSCRTYSTGGTPVPTPFPTPIPNTGGTPIPGPANPNGVVAPAPPPNAAPSLPFFGAGMSMAPSLFGRASFAGATQSSYLDGYSNYAPIQPVAAGTPLTHGHLFGSHIFQVLRQFGGNSQDRNGLLNMAITAFGNASGFTPTALEISFLQQIVDRFLRHGGSTEPDPLPTGTGTGTGTGIVAAGGSNVIRIIVTIEVPPGAKVVGVGTAGSPQVGAGGTGDDQANPPNPPAPPPGLTAPVPAPAPPTPAPSAPAPSTP